MAKAEARRKIITEVTGVTLTLSDSEAQLIRNLLGHVVPNMALNSGRDFASIRSALEDEGYRFQFKNPQFYSGEGVRIIR